MRYTYLALTAVLALLLGCATQADVDINNAFDRAQATHSLAEGAAVESKALHIRSMLEFDCVDDTAACGAAQAFAKAMAADKIASMQTRPFEGKRGKTGLDVQEKLIDKLNPLEIGLGIRLTKQDARPNNQVINTEDGDINAKNTMNNPAINNTAGYGNAQGGFDASDEANTTLPEPVPE